MRIKTFQESVRDFWNKYGYYGTCDLSDALEVAVSTVDRWKDGRSTPDPRVQALILAYINDYNLCACGQSIRDPEHKWVETTCVDVISDILRHQRNIIRHLEQAANLLKTINERRRNT